MRNYKHAKNNKLEKTLEEVIKRHAKFKTVHFWGPVSGSRRSYERQNSFSCEFKLKGNDYSIDQVIYCGGSYTSYKLNLRVNGEKKNITALKKLVA